MTTQEFQASISFLFAPNAVLGLELYLILNVNNELQIRQADLEDQLQDEILNGFKEYLRSRAMQNESMEVKPLSELDNSRDTIHQYDLQGFPEGLDIINSNLDPNTIPYFNFNNDELENITAFLIKLSSVNEHIVLYKKNSHLNILKQKRLVYFIKDNERFTKSNEDILRFSFSVDFIKIDQEIFVDNIKTLEKEFAFSDILINNAQVKVIQIAGLNLVENIEELDEMAQEKSGAKSILRLRDDSPVLELPFNTIKQFVKNHPYLRRRLKFNNGETMFIFHTKSSRTYFLNLLNDNYLTSDLTSLFYKTNSKSPMTSEEDEA